MHKLTTQETRAIMLELLDELAAFCDAHGLRYYLAYGTLLGAARHQGFIPWDDDLDVMMPEEDFLKLLQGYHSDDYEVVRCDTDRRVSLTMGRIYSNRTYGMRHGRRSLGISIDIYLMYGSPQGEQAIAEHIANLRRHGKTAQKWRRRALFVAHRHLLPERWNFLSDILTHYTHKRVQEYEKYPFGSGDYTFLTTDTRLYDKAIFESRVRLPFEGKEYYVPIGWDKCLTVRYKDYMQLPPEKDRHPAHQTTAYYTNE